MNVDRTFAEDRISRHPNAPSASSRIFAPRRWLNPCARLVAGLLVVIATQSALAATSPGSGLYKDGRLILGFEDLAHAPRSATSAAPTSSGRALGQLLDSSPPGARTALREYAETVLAIRKLVSEPGDLDRPEVAGEFQALQSRLDDVSRRALDGLTTARAHLGEVGISDAKSERVATLGTAIEEESRQISIHLSAMREAVERSDPALEATRAAEFRKFFEHRVTREDPPMMNLHPSPSIMERRAPAIVREERDARLPAPESARPRFLNDPTPADLAPTIDVQFTPAITALATSLGQSPARMFEYVRQNVEFEAYLGSRKGSQQTLDHRRGNDYDQASLLIALLRSSGVPARYASGTMKLPIDRATNWLGIDDKDNAASLLATAGMQGTLYIVNNDTVAVSCTRVWVEAWLPFINYRGAANQDSAGKQWIPLDPAFKQYVVTRGTNGPAQTSFDGEAFVDSYIATFHAQPPVALFKQQLLSQTGLPEASLVTTRTVIPETDGILPGTLPWELLSSTGAFSEIAANKRYTVRFHVYGSGTDLDYTTSIPGIAGKQVTISYVGATPADQQIIDTAGGGFNVQDPYLVDLKPVLKIDGCQVAIGSGQVMMGITHNSDMLFTVPAGASNQVPVVANVITAGNIQGIGIDTEDALPASGPVQTTCPEDLLAQELHQTALTYLNNVDVAGDEAARLMHLVVLNDVAEAIVENQVTVYFSGGLPISFDWAGMIVDADRKILGPFSVDGLPNTCDYMRLGGADGSVQENRLFETRFGEEAISTIKILELASDSGIVVCRITSSIGADCPGMNQPPQVVSAINAALAQGHHVIIPKRGFTYHDWSGTGWIDLDPVTCAAGYIISGGQGGGATVQTWSITYPDLHCIQPIGPITVAPAATGDLYCGESSSKWTFTVPTIKFWGKNPQGQCNLLGTESKNFDVQYTIKEIADTYGPGEYVFKIGSSTSDCGCTTIEKHVTIVKITIEKPADDRSVFVKGQEIAFESKFDPDLGGLTPAWSVEAGTCSPASGSAKKFETTLNSEGTITVKLSVTVGGQPCEVKRTVKTVVPEVIEVNFTGSPVSLKSHATGGVVSSNTVSEWKRKRGDADPNLNHDTAYGSSSGSDATVMCKMKCEASDALTDAADVQVKANGNAANLNQKDTQFKDWTDFVDMNDGVALPKTIRQFVNNYDYAWQYRVKTLSGGWGSWVDMSNNPTHHNISVAAGGASGTHYEWVFMDACKLADGTSSTATPKTIVDAVYVNLPGLRSSGSDVITAADWAATNALHYGGRSGTAPDRVSLILKGGIGMCGEWSHFFAALAAVHNVTLDKRCYYLQNDVTPYERKWDAIVISAPGLNQTAPTFPANTFGDIMASTYPFAKFFGVASATDQVDVRTEKRYVFFSPGDGHCIDFLVEGGNNYLYDASFGPYTAAGIKLNTYPSVPLGRKNGAVNSTFRSTYFNGDATRGVRYLLGVLWYRYANDTPLTAAVNATVTTIPVTSTASATAAGIIRIDNEVITYTGKTATSFTGCTRGTNGTAAAAHANAAGVALIKQDVQLDAPTADVESGGLNLDWVVTP